MVEKSIVVIKVFKEQSVSITLRGPFYSITSPALTSHELQTTSNYASFQLSVTPVSKNNFLRRLS